MTLINVTLPDGTINEYAAGITCSEIISDALGQKKWLYCGKSRRY